MPQTRFNPEVLVFDVNETLLDLSAMQPLFRQTFGDSTALRDWFGLLLQYSLVTTITEHYYDFAALGKATFRMLAEARNVKLPVGGEGQVIQALKSLPAHSDVSPSLDRLRKAGYRLATLTNSSPTMIDAQLRNSGLSGYFEEVISVEEVRRFKPHRSVYENAALRLKIQPSGACLIAAHAWDVFGAMSAGWSAAFVARPGKVLFPLAAAPDAVADNMHDIATVLIEQRRTGQQK